MKEREVPTVKRLKDRIAAIDDKLQIPYPEHHETVATYPVKTAWGEKELTHPVTIDVYPRGGEDTILTLPNKKELVVGAKNIFIGKVVRMIRSY